MTPEAIAYATIRPMPLNPAPWWRYPDCSGSPHVRRVCTFMEWYDARSGRA
jgi:hypothetical protein